MENSNTSPGSTQTLRFFFSILPPQKKKKKPTKPGGVTARLIGLSFKGGRDFFDNISIACALF